MKKIGIRLRRGFLSQGPWCRVHRFTYCLELRDSRKHRFGNCCLTTRNKQNAPTNVLILSSTNFTFRQLFRTTCVQKGAILTNNVYTPTCNSSCSVIVVFAILYVYDSCTVNTECVRRTSTRYDFEGFAPTVARQAAQSVVFEYVSGHLGIFKSRFQAFLIFRVQYTFRTVRERTFNICRIDCKKHNMF